MPCYVTSMSNYVLLTPLSDFQNINKISSQPHIFPSYLIKLMSYSYIGTFPLHFLPSSLPSFLSLQSSLREEPPAVTRHQQLSRHCPSPSSPPLPSPSHPLVPLTSVPRPHPPVLTVPASISSHSLTHSLITHSSVLIPLLLLLLLLPYFIFYL